MKILKNKLESGEDLSESEKEMISKIKKNRLKRVGTHAAIGAGVGAGASLDKTGYIINSANGIYNGAAIGAMTNKGTNQRLKALIAKELKGTITDEEKEEYKALKAKRKNRVNIGAGIGGALGAGGTTYMLARNKKE